MTFLNPAVLFGLLAASIPVLIHLLNLRKLKRIDFSTLSFLKELQKNKIRKIKLKQWLLLVLRVLIILGIVFAFARPALRGTTIGGAASTAKSTAVFILDDTFSMTVIGSRGSYLNQAKETIKHLVRDMQEGDEAALILVSGKDNDEVSASSNLSDFIKKVDDTEISYSSGYLHDAVAKSAEIISSSKNFNKEVYIFSDFQYNRISEEKGLSDFSEVFNENVKLYGFNFSGKNIYNLAVTDFKLQTQIFEKDKPVLFDVTVTNFSSDDVNDAVISLFMNGERAGQKSIDISSGSSVTISLEANLKVTGYIDFWCELEDDEILHDNKRFISVNIPGEIPVAIFYENENDVRFIELALKAAGTNNPLKISAFSNSRISSLNLASYKSIILSAGSGLTNGLDKIKTFIENGGGVALFPSSTSTPESFSLLSKSLSLPDITGSTGKKGESSVVNRFDEIDFEHPLFTNIFLNEDKKKIESPDIYYSYKISPSGKGRNIVGLSDGSSFMSEYTAGRSKIIIFNSLPHTEWSNLPVKGIFPRLIYKAVLYLSYLQQQDENLFAGDAAVINLSGRAVPQINITRPDGGSGTINTAGENYVSYKNTATAGIYNIGFNDEIIDRFEVNTDPAESINRFAKEEEFKEYLEKIDFKGKFVNIDITKDPADEILQARFGSELWKFFAVLTLLLAVTEMTIARSIKRDLVTIKK